MERKGKPCLVCGKSHDFVMDYIVCEATELESVVVQVTDRDWKIMQRWLDQTGPLEDRGLNS